MDLQKLQKGYNEINKTKKTNFLNNVERVPYCKTKFVFTMLTRKIRLLRRISKAVEAVCKWNGMIFTIMEFRIFKNRRLKMRKKIVNSLITATVIGHIFM